MKIVDLLRKILFGENILKQLTFYHNTIKSQIEFLDYKIDNLTKNLITSDVFDIDKIQVSFTLFDSQLNAIINDYQKKYKSYSQYKEDLVIKYLFDRLSISKPSYIDIGAYDPKCLSNTALLYENGSRGINIEPNADFYKKFESLRKDDINLNCGIGIDEGFSDYYVIKDHPALNTFSKKQIEKLKFIDRAISVKKKKIHVRNVNNILEENDFYPDFISIDVEGMDFDIINNLQFKFMPKLMCVEINHHGVGGRILDIDKIMFKKGYFIFATIGGNSLYLKKEYLKHLM